MKISLNLITNKGTLVQVTNFKDGKKERRKKESFLNASNKKGVQFVEKQEEVE
jgi:hypothetical protein